MGQGIYYQARKLSLKVRLSVNSSGFLSIAMWINWLDHPPLAVVKGSVDYLLFISLSYILSFKIRSVIIYQYILYALEFRAITQEICLDVYSSNTL